MDWKNNIGIQKGAFGFRFTCSDKSCGHTQSFKGRVFNFVKRAAEKRGWTIYDTGVIRCPHHDLPKGKVTIVESASRSRPYDK